MTILATIPREPAPVATCRLIAGAWRDMWRTWPALWPLWLLSGLLTAVIELTFHVLRPVGAPIGGRFLEQLASTTLSAVSWAIIAGLALPVLLRHRAQVGKLSRELAPYVRGYVLLSVGFMLAAVAVGRVAPPPTLLLVFPVSITVLFVGSLALAPWVLWTVSQLPEAGRLTVADAWRIGPGGAWAYATAFCAVGGVPVLLEWMLAALFDQSGNLLALGLACSAGALAMMWETALAAVFFRQRLGLERPASLAEVFD